MATLTDESHILLFFFFHCYGRLIAYQIFFVFDLYMYHFSIIILNHTYIILNNITSTGSIATSKVYLVIHLRLKEKVKVEGVTDMYTDLCVQVIDSTILKYLSGDFEFD